MRLLRGWRRDRAGEALDTDLQPAVGSYSGLGFSCLLCCPRKLLMVVFPLFLGPTTKILTLVGAALIPVRGEAVAGRQPLSIAGQRPWRQRCLPRAASRLGASL